MAMTLTDVDKDVMNRLLYAFENFLLLANTYEQITKITERLYIKFPFLRYFNCFNNIGLSSLNPFTLPAGNDFPFFVYAPPKSKKQQKEEEHDFPSVGDSVGFDVPQKSKKQQKEEERKKAVAKKQAEIDAMPHKGKPSEFFKLQRDHEGKAMIKPEQMDFIYLYYITYADPEDSEKLLDRLYECAKAFEDFNKPMDAADEKAKKKRDAVLIEMEEETKIKNQENPEQNT
jgi:hypothetical protein